MSEPCTTCFECRDSIISTSAVTRTQALQRFVELQGEGYAPAMCEGLNGRYTVCFNAGHRPMIAHRWHTIGQPAVDRRP